jgi:hypothetical protein
VRVFLCCNDVALLTLVPFHDETPPQY